MIHKTKVKECKMDAIIVDAVISGSRCRGIYHTYYDNNERRA